MKIFSQFFIFILLLTSSLFPQGYKLIWSDEFVGTALDQKSWTFETGNHNGWGNGESEYYTNRVQNCAVQNGILTINAVKESYSGYNYTSARIKTQGNVSVKYGKIEAKIKLPFGQGIWPAFWMLGDNINVLGWPKCGEIDIMEMIGGQGRNKTVYGSAHWGGDYSNSFSLSSGIFADNFHIFDITWDQTKIVWHVDGITYNTLNISPSGLSAFQNSFFIILNLAVGGNWPGYPDNSTVFPQTMQLDYVRVYQDTTIFSNSGEKNTEHSKYFLLGQNYPNPFNPSTTINYSLAKEGAVKITIYNTIGSKVTVLVDEFKPVGNYSVQFNGDNITSGIYLYRLESGVYNSTKKLILMK